MLPFADIICVLVICMFAVMESIIAHQCPNEQTGNVSMYRTNGSSSYDISQIASIIDALENLNILDGKKQNCYMLDVITATSNQLDATNLIVDIKLHITDLGLSLTQDSCTDTPGLTVIPQGETTGGNLDRTVDSNATEKAPPPPHIVEPAEGKRYGRLSGTQLLVITTCSSVIGLFFIAALIMRVRNYVKRQRAEEQQASRQNFRSTSVALRGEPTPQKNSVTSKTGYSDQVTWPKEMFQNGSPFRKPHNYRHPHHQDNKPLLVITSASAPASPHVIKPPTQNKEKVRYMPSDPSSSGIHERPMQHLTIHHQPLFRQRTPTPTNQIHSFHRIPKESKGSRSYTDESFLPDDFNAQLPNISSVVNSVPMYNASTSESSSRKGSGSSLAQSLSLSFDGYYRDKLMAKTGSTASCKTQNDSTNGPIKNKEDNGASQTDNSPEQQYGNHVPPNVDVYLSSPSGYESSSSGNTEHLKSQPRTPAENYILGFDTMATIENTESNEIDTLESHSSDDSDRSYSIGSLSDSCDVFLSADTPSSRPDPQASSSSILKQPILHITEPIADPSPNQLKPHPQTRNDQASAAANIVPKSVSFSLEESESLGSDISQDSVQDELVNGPDGKHCEENSLLLQPEFQGMKPTFV